MTIRVQAVTGRPVKGNIAIRAYNTNILVQGGQPVAVYKVSDAEIAAGIFKVSGNSAHQFMVYETTDETPNGGAAIPVYIVNATPPAPTLDPEYLAYEGAMSTTPSTTWREAGSQLFIDLRAALGVVSLNAALDFMYILAAETEQAGLLNAANPGAHTATNVNSVAFEASRGFTGNGTNSYLNTNYNPTASAINFARNNAALGVYSRTNIANNTYFDIGAGGFLQVAANINTRAAAGVANGSINAADGQFSANNPNSLSLHVLNRSASNVTVMYKAGNQIGNVSTTLSTGIPNRNFYICAANTNPNYSVRQLAFAFTGRAMNATEQLNFYTAVQTFMAAIGAQVTP